MSLTNIISPPSHPFPVLSCFAWQTPKLCVTCDNAMDLGLEPGLPSWALCSPPSCFPECPGEGELEIRTWNADVIISALLYKHEASWLCRMLYKYPDKKISEKTLRASELLKPAFKPESGWCHSASLCRFQVLTCLVHLGAGAHGATPPKECWCLPERSAEEEEAGPQGLNVSKVRRGNPLPTG